MGDMQESVLEMLCTPLGRCCEMKNLRALRDEGANHEVQIGWDDERSDKV